MLRPRILLFLSLASLGLGGRGEAAIMLTAEITNTQEVPPAPPANPPTNPTTSTGAPRPTPFGSATFIINDDMTAMTFNATIFNIDVTGTQTADTNDNLVNAHLHAGAATGGPGTNAGVVWGFFGTPFNNTSPNDGVVTPFLPSSGLVGGTFSGTWNAPEGNNTTLTAQLANILAGRSYINFHTVQFPGGEIRGQLLTVASVPEPSTAALLGIGGVVLAGAGWRSRKRAR